MRHSATIRLFSLVMGLVASFATPALAVVHGHEHSESAEHQAGVSHAPAGAELSGVEHETGHGHAAVTAGVAKRWTDLATAAVASPVTVAVAPIGPSETHVGVPRSEAVPPSAEPPPNSTRAPPA